MLYKGDSNGIFLSDLLQEFEEMMYVKHLGEHLGSALELLAITLLNQKLGQNIKIMLLRILETRKPQIMVVNGNQQFD